MAIERFGYTKAQSKARPNAQEEEFTREPVQKSNLKAVNSNKRRSASPLSGGGRGGDIPVTLENAANEMTLGEFASLDPSVIAQLEGMGG